MKILIITDKKIVNFHKKIIDKLSSNNDVEVITLGSIITQKYNISESLISDLLWRVFFKIENILLKRYSHRDARAKELLKIITECSKSNSRLKYKKVDINTLQQQEYDLIIDISIYTKSGIIYKNISAPVISFTIGSENYDPPALQSIIN